jgi:hypothetical protein
MFYLFVLVDNNGIKTEVSAGYNGFELKEKTRVFVGSDLQEAGSMIRIQQGKSAIMKVFSPHELVNPLRVEGVNLLLPIKRSQENLIKQSIATSA